MSLIYRIMKKVFAVAAAVLLCVSASYAQSFRDMFRTDAKGGLEYGIRAGLNVSDISAKYVYDDGPTEKYNFKSQAGFHVGGVIGVPVTNGFYVQSGLMFTSKGARHTDKVEDYKYVTSMFPVYLEIPVLASFRADVASSVNLQVNVGPYFDFGLGGKTSSKSTEDGETYKESIPFFGKSTEDKWRSGMKRFDLGLSFGAGVELWDHYYVGIKYDLGLVNMAIKDELGEGYKAHNGTFAISLGYNF